MNLLFEMPRTKRVSVESLIERLYHTEGKAEIINCENLIKSYTFYDPDSPNTYKRGEIANAEFALPTWTFDVDELFE